MTMYMHMGGCKEGAMQYAPQGVPFRRLEPLNNAWPSRFLLDVRNFEMFNHQQGGIYIHPDYLKEVTSTSIRGQI